MRLAVADMGSQDRTPTERTASIAPAATGRQMASERR